MNVTVVRAANVLNICERELFEFAHLYWYTQQAESSFITTVLQEYLQKHITPPWVMHFARAVMRAYQMGCFDPKSFGIIPAVEEVPLLWSLAFRTPRLQRCAESDSQFIA